MPSMLRYWKKFAAGCSVLAGATLGSADVAIADGTDLRRREVATSPEESAGAHFSDGSVQYWQALSLPGGEDSVTHLDDGTIVFVSLRLYQDTAPLQPLPIEPAPTPVTPATADSVANIFRGRSNSNLLQLASVQRAERRVAADRILGIESKARSTSDVGSLLSKSAQNRGVVAQKRNPIITDPRIRGSRVGQLAASGSHWVPARIDLDTVLSKVDSDLISSVDVVKGPYAVEYGPGVSFLSFDLVHSPRSDNGPVFGGSTSLEYQTNGDQWYGRQTVNYADENWGAQVGYGHRTGSDYTAGNGVGIPSSHKSRDLDVALGFDIAPGQSLEVFYLHQDQTGVELAGQAFDIDSLTTDALETTWINESIDWADRLEVEGWYNTSQLKGNAQNASKRITFPFLDTIRYVGNTAVDTVSTGARAQAVWELETDRELSAGVDIRIIRQRLDEISSLQNQNVLVTNANSPIPHSVAANPGLFLQLTDQTIDDLVLTAGARTDIVTTDVLADAASLQNLGTSLTPRSLADILGTSDLNQVFGLWSAFVTAEYAVDDYWSVNAAAGHGQRAPSLTELYAAESYMFLLQSGLNTITGDPRLNPERRWQIDLGTSFNSDNFRASVNGYHAWINDRITFEALSVRRGPPSNQIEQVNLKYVNTDLATLSGVEAAAEYDLFDSLSAFGTLSYVRGTDQTRNGSFATLQSGSAGASSVRIPGLQRGTFGTNSPGPLPGKEPLPGIPPLESRVGLRANGLWHEMLWNLEFGARIVNQQSRVATLLYETRTPGFTTFDIRGYLRVNSSLSIFAGVENLTNKSYREHFDFRSLNGTSVLQPGINAYFGTELVY